MEATPESVGYTRHICIKCNYSYISDIVTSGDTGYIPQPAEPTEPHSHSYQLYVQDNTQGKFFIVLRVCNCGDVRGGGLSVLASKDGTNFSPLTVNAYGQVFYSDLTARYEVKVLDELGRELKTFWLTSQGVSEQKPATPGQNQQTTPPTEQDKPGTSVDPAEQDKPNQNPGGQTPPADQETPGITADPDETDTPENPDAEGQQKSNKGVTSIVLFFVLIVLAGGGLAAYIIIKKKKKNKKN